LRRLGKRAPGITVEWQSEIEEESESDSGQTTAATATSHGRIDLPKIISDDEKTHASFSGLFEELTGRPFKNRPIFQRQR